MNMPDVSNTYGRIAENNVKALRSRCLRGMFSEAMFRTVAKGLDRFYTLEMLDWMKEFLTSQNQHIAAGCLECLCAHGRSGRACLGEIDGIMSVMRSFRERLGNRRRRT